jgi:hypothetical protein
VPNEPSDEIGEALEECARDAEADSQSEAVVPEPTIPRIHSSEQSFEIIDSWITRFRARRAARREGPGQP